MPPQPASERNLQVVAAYRSGLTMAEVGRRFGIGKARVSQIVRKYDPIDPVTGERVNSSPG